MEFDLNSASTGKMCVCVTPLGSNGLQRSHTPSHIKANYINPTSAQLKQQENRE